MLRQDKLVVIDLCHDQGDRYCLQWVLADGAQGSLIGSEGWRSQALKRSVEALTLALRNRKPAIAWLTLVEGRLYSSRTSDGIFLFSTKLLALKARGAIYSRLRIDALRMRDLGGSQDLRTDNVPWIFRQ